MLYYYIVLLYLLSVGSEAQNYTDKCYELVEKREETVKHFTSTDGERVAFMHVYPIHYLKDGKWVNIDSTLVATESGLVHNKANSWRIEFGENLCTAGVSLRRDDKIVNWRIPSNDCAHELPRIEHRTYVRYVNAFPNADLVYRVHSSGIEEYIEVFSPNASSSYVFEISGDGLMYGESGELIAFDYVTGAVFGEPFVVQKPNLPPNVNRYAKPRIDIKSISRKRSTMVKHSLAAISVDDAWLRSIPISQFPITIDPSVTFKSSKITSYKFYPSGSKKGQNAATRTDGVIGNPDDAGTRWRAVVAFSYSSIYKWTVTAVTLKTSANVMGSTCPVKVFWANGWNNHVSTGPKGGWSATKASASNMAASNSLTGSALTSMWNSWTTASTANQLHLFQGNEGSAYGWRTFSVSAVITYKATCSPACTSHGACNSPNKCTCSTGWSGATCATPSCATPCQHGKCVDINKCSCNAGYGGNACQTPLCSPTCVQGSCTSPNVCKCTTGWNGNTCANPICSTPCAHGTCTSPDTCTCTAGWKGSLCETPICATACVAPNICVSPNQCSNQPFVTRVTPVSTLGGRVTISGNNFGNNATNMTASISAGQCVNITLYNSTSFSCVMPAGTGGALRVAMVVKTTPNSYDQNKAFSYRAPTIANITSVRTAGGAITINGGNFGTSAAAISIVAGGKTCTNVTVLTAHTKLRCNMPPGYNAHLPLMLTVTSQVDDSDIDFSYLAPVVNSYSTLETIGGGVTIVGDNFGFDQNLLGLAIGLDECDNFTILTPHTKFACVMEKGAGAYITSKVSADDYVTLFNFSFAQPTISSTTVVPTEGDFTLIDGNNFGDDEDIISVDIDGFPCINLTLVEAHKQITCIAPAGSGFDLPVQITIGGNVATFYGFQYEAPSVDFVTLKTNTSASRVTISGNNFGSYGLDIEIYFGDYECTNVLIEEENNKISCILPGGPIEPLFVDVIVSGQNTNNDTNYWYLYAEDFCAAGYCDPLTNCSGIAENVTCSPCPDGYTGDGINGCLDIDECAFTNRSDCPWLKDCINTPGSYLCEDCDSGYTRVNVTENTGCVDIDECLDPYSCSAFAECTNNNGGFDCECNPGFNGNGFVCEDIDECKIADICAPLTKCNNTFGNYTCGSCPNGYIGDGYTVCKDIDECELSDTCDVLSTCNNTIGGFTCSPCPNGYYGAAYGPNSCIDINECDPLNPCDPLTTCENTIGNYTCTPCPEGYSGDSRDKCHDIDECTDYLGICDPLTTCNNTIGNYTCSPCPSGYSGDSRVECKDIDECTDYPGVCDPLTSCNNTGICDLLTSCNNTIGNYTCSPCPGGYSGDSRVECKDIDECTDTPNICDPLTHCNNTIGNYTCSPCPTGYSGDSRDKCHDIDECTDLSNACDTLTHCNNTIGSYNCTPCPTGYSGDPKLGCKDIDECEILPSVCDGLSNCTNTMGNFTCSPCPRGYIGESRDKCHDNDECANLPNACDPLAVCSNYIGNYTCSPCPPGYSGDSRVKCKDINECSTLPNPCDSLTVCSNTIGNYTCSQCPKGYSGDSKVQCEDINECATIPNVCDPLTVCSNTIGNYTCTPCPEGYSGDSKVKCEDINECTTLPNPCDALTVCTNTIGNYTCTPCPAGYSGNSKVKCEDINECAQLPNACDHLTNCTNTIGNYTCTPCPGGYSGDPKVHCRDIDECQITPSVCAFGTNCTNRNGDFVCSPCPVGFVGNSYENCTDYDECLNNPTVCDPLSKCTNTIGNFTCAACPRGYYGNPYVKCDDINECTSNPCDSHSNCTNTAGNFTCSACPAGFTGNPYVKCTEIPKKLVCGDGICSPGLEDCLSCADDCVAPCNMCGDGVCDAKIGENCTSCAIDCHACKFPTCPGTPACNGQGDCVYGVCQCNSTHVGKACESESTAPLIVVTANNTISILPTTRQNDINTDFADLFAKFDVTILELREMDQYDKIITNIDLSTIPAVSTQFKNNWNVSFDLPNGAHLLVIIYLYSETTNVKFAGQTLSFPNNTVKFYADISEWPFASLKNSLGVVMSTNGVQLKKQENSGNCGNTAANDDEYITDSSGNLLYFTMERGGAELYTKFLPLAEIDDLPKPVKVDVLDENKVMARLPYFWRHGVMDPSYNVLLSAGSDTSKDECNNLLSGGAQPQNMQTAAIAATVAVVGAAAIGTAGYLGYKRRMHLAFRQRISSTRSSTNLL